MFAIFKMKYTQFDEFSESLIWYTVNNNDPLKRNDQILRKSPYCYLCIFCVHQ